MYAFFTRAQAIYKTFFYLPNYLSFKKTTEDNYDFYKRGFDIPSEN